MNRLHFYLGLSEIQRATVSGKALAAGCVPSSLLQPARCRSILTSHLYLLAIAIASLQSTFATAAEERPNIVWIVTEDNSAEWLRLYNSQGAAMPNVERLAKSGIVFNNAFSNAPVCSVARSTIISGCYAPRTGTQYHRRTALVPLPDGLEMFPAYLRKAGYYTTNCAKEDYNFTKADNVWDASSGKATYRNRKPNQPFFHVQNFGTTHEGKLHFPESAVDNKPTTTDPSSVEIFPYHPDTKLFRYTYARQLDHHMNVDKQIGDFLGKLESDGLMNDTIIFYYGDHGGVLPRGKGYIQESGLHVPMVVYVPEKWQKLVNIPNGKVDGFVSFIDLAPTVLNLAGVKVPSAMDGKPFLGEGVTLDELNSRDVTYGYADRFDEKYDLVRSYRKGNFKYLRNYQPFNHDGLMNEYRYKMAAYREWRELMAESKLNELQQQFFENREPEGLYDLSSDPHETKNLAADPAYRDKLLEMRKGLKQWVVSMPDLSFHPEPYFVNRAISNPVAFGQRHKEEIERLVQIADLQLLPFSEARDKLKTALYSPKSWERYWAMIVCSTFGKEAAEFNNTIKLMSQNDERPLVRVRAAEFMGLTGLADPRPAIMEVLKTSDDPTLLNLTLNSATMLHESSGKFRFDLSDDLYPRKLLYRGAGRRARRSYVGQRIDYLTEWKTETGTESIAP